MPDKAEKDKSKKPEPSRREKILKELNEQPAVKRGEQKIVEVLEMPPVEPAAQYLLDYLFEIGPTQAGGMGPAPLSHAELLAWQHNTGIDLNSWEARLLKRLSIEYMSESHYAIEPGRPAPWADAPYLKPEASRVAMEMKKAIAKMINL